MGARCPQPTPLCRPGCVPLHEHVMVTGFGARSSAPGKNTVTCAQSEETVSYGTIADIPSSHLHRGHLPESSQRRGLPSGNDASFQPPVSTRTSEGHASYVFGSQLQACPSAQGPEATPIPSQSRE